eukprot:gene20502-22519_t
MKLRTMNVALIVGMLVMTSVCSQHCDNSIGQISNKNGESQTSTCQTSKEENGSGLMKSLKSLRVDTQWAHFKIGMWCIMVMLPRGTTTPRPGSEQEKRIANSVKKLLANDYSATRPNITGGPLELKVGLHFIKFDEISTKKQSYESDVYLRMLWKDTRLCHNETEDIFISGDPPGNIWRPDIYFESALKTDKSEIAKYNYFIQIKKDGSIYSSIRATVVAKCPQSVMYYPFDSQHCEMIIQSFGHTKNRLILKWHQPSPVSIQNRQLQQFTIREIKLGKSQGKYSIGDRIALGISCLLTLVFLMTSINESLPKVSYAKTIDFYLIGCFMYVLSVAIETVIAKQLSERGDERVEDKEWEEDVSSRKYTFRKPYKDESTSTTIQNPTAMMTNVKILGQDDNHSISTINTANIELDSRHDNAIGKKEIATQQQKTAVKKLTSAKRLDKYCRVVYPALFVVLNLFYFIMCVRNGKHVDQEERSSIY